MNWSSRTYGDRPSVNTGDPLEPLQGIAKARAKFLDRCWCGNLKHSDMPLCNLCKRVGETDNG